MCSTCLVNDPTTKIKHNVIEGVVMTYLGDQYHAIQWCYSEHDGVLNHRRHDCLVKRLFKWISKKISKLRVTGFHGVINSPHKEPFDYIIIDYRYPRKPREKIKLLVWLNPLVLEIAFNNSESAIAEQMLLIKFISTSHEIALGSMPQNTWWCQHWFRYLLGDITQ